MKPREEQAVLSLLFTGTNQEEQHPAKHPPFFFVRIHNAITAFRLCFKNIPAHGKIQLTLTGTTDYRNNCGIEPLCPESSPSFRIFVSRAACWPANIFAYHITFYVRDYLLVIDTEASGLPKKWNAPYSTNDAWPHAIQVSWVVYDKNRQVVKEQDHYIQCTGFTIEPASIKVHGLTPDFLMAHGQRRDLVMQWLQADLLEYQPLIIGHFLELDLHITGAAFYRSGLQNPMTELPCFCTMISTTRLVRNPQTKYLRLGDLYEILFHRPLTHQHNSLMDARATADCFFELLHRGDITETTINEQQAVISKAKADVKKAGWAMVVLAVFLVTLLIACTV